MKPLVVILNRTGLPALILVLALCFSGCGSDATNADNSLREAVAKPNFVQHIAPLIKEHCLGCHRPQGIAPFALNSFNLARKKAKTIAKVTSLRIMPPWPADPNYSHFIGENILSEAQIKTLQNWVSGGCEEGDYATAEPGFFTKERTIPVSDYKSTIGKPDLVIPVPPIAIKNNGLDQFYLSKTQVKLPANAVISALEFVPGNKDLVHHANGHLILYPKGRKRVGPFEQRLVNITPGNYESDFKQLDLLNDDQSIPERVHSAVNYLPGVLGVKYPNGIGGIAVPKEFALALVDLHYGPSDRNTIDSSVVNVFFRKEPPTRPTFEINLGTDGVGKITPPLVIPPNQITKHSVSYTIEKPITVLTINPHLHLLGKSFKAYAVKPNGDTVPLISIPKWNFRWQYFYTFKQAQVLSAGTTITAWAEFDNTVQNHNNPNHPPKQVSERWEDGGNSMRASDEMFQFIITYIPYQKGDEQLTLESKKK